MLGMSAIEGIETVAIASPGRELQATFAPNAGMVCCSLLHAGEELLAQRRGLRAYAEHGSTMGIPLLHPWANRLAGLAYGIAPEDIVELDPHSPLIRRDENGLPIHGVLASRLPWRVQHAGSSELRVQMLWRAPDLLALFPFPHQLDLSVTIDARALRIQTTVLATGDAPVPVSFGFHPYLTLPGIDRRGWRIELPPMRRLLLDRLKIPTGAVEPVAASTFELAEQSWDDAFDGLSGSSLFSLSGGGRRIALKLLEGYTCAQVFGPETESFVCFEPMTAPTNALVSRRGLRTVQPGAELSATFEVEVSRAT